MSHYIDWKQVDDAKIDPVRLEAFLKKVRRLKPEDGKYFAELVSTLTLETTVKKSPTRKVVQIETWFDGFKDSEGDTRINHMSPESDSVVGFLRDLAECLLESTVFLVLDEGFPTGSENAWRVVLDPKDGVSVKNLRLTEA